MDGRQGFLNRSLYKILNSPLALPGRDNSFKNEMVTIYLRKR